MGLMPVQSLNSIFNYVPQPYFTAAYSSVSAYVQIDTIENSSGLLDPDLSNYTTVVPNSGVSEFGFKVRHSCDDDYLATVNMSTALIGCSMLTYADDGGGAPNLDTVFSEDIVCAMATGIGTTGNQLITFAHSSQNEIKTFGREPLPGIIAGGQTNLLFHGLGTADVTAPSTFSFFTFPRNTDDVTARPPCSSDRWAPFYWYGPPYYHRPEFLFLEPGAGNPAFLCPRPGRKKFRGFYPSQSQW